jgi:universal stress protein E
MTHDFAFKNLLVGLDDKTLADEAVAAAAAVAEVTGANLELVHACALPHRHLIHESAARHQELQDMLVANVVSKLEVRLHALEQRLGLERDALVARLAVIPGSPARVLAHRARETAADVLFLGTHEKHGKFDFGSTVRSALQHAPCALWVQSVPWKSMKRVLAPVDFSPSSMVALGLARDLAAAAEAELVVLYVHVADDLFSTVEESAPGWPTYVPADMRAKDLEHFEETLRAFDWRGVPHDDVFVDGDPVQRILEARKDLDLIVMATHGHSGIAGLFLGDVTYSVMREGGVGMLALRAKD